MEITNNTDNLKAIKFKMPSGEDFRLEIKGGEVVVVNNAVRMGLEANSYFEHLRNSQVLSVRFTETEQVIDAPVEDDSYEGEE